MRVVWCPHPELLKLCRGREREILAGGDCGSGSGSISGTGADGDGWAVLVETLEDFDYGRFGIEL